MALSIAESLKLKIEDEILMFNFKPGERLDESRLAERYGSSRTPVREALRQLAAEGFVRIRPHRGAVVSGLSMAELVEMFEMMAIYEGVCARLAARHATPDEMIQIEAGHDACRAFCEADDFDGYCLANARFHESVYRASHNSFLIKQTVSIRNRLGAYRRFQLRRNNRLRDSFREHQAVLDAIKGGHAEEADRLMREHITVQGSHITSLITRLPPEYFPDSPKGQAAAVPPRWGSSTYPAAALAFE
ncbi:MULTISPECIES: GntR family transcriptional regulator [Rhodomicrobium]|uniref:GntR family transcriptional regulator n=1 Tax=Rhodomicrobium TaxID=1068 RepID=UPI000B4B0EF8|nr:MULTISPECIES: GntR family transcriptional regulator [Rhodomicrobium]